MRDDFESVLTGRPCTRHPDACRRSVPFRDEEVDDAPALGRSRVFEKGWREDSSFRYRLIPRFLRSRVGRSFDGVMAELAGAVTDARLRRMAEREVRRHVEDTRRGSAEGGRAWCLPAAFTVDADGVLRPGPPRLGPATRATRAGLRRLTAVDRMQVTDPLSPQAEHVALERVGVVWFALRWTRLPGPGVGCPSLTLVVDGRRETYHDGPARRSQVSGRDTRRLDLAGWSADAEALEGSVRGRAYDRSAKARQEGRIRVAARALAKGSNRAASLDVAPGTT